MKIVHLSDYYQPKIGYQEPNIAKAHKNMGHEVHVITSDRYFPFPQYSKNFQKILGKRIRKPGIFDEDGITVHRLPVYFEYEPSAIPVLKGIKKTLKSIQPDIVFSHDILNLSPYFTAKYKKSFGYKLIFDNHAAFFNSDLTNTGLKRIYMRLWKAFIRNKILKNADKIVAIGKEEQNLACHVLNILPKEVPIIPLGADIKRFSSNKKVRHETRKLLRLSPKEICIIYAGKITKEKRVELLIKAFCEIQKKWKNAKLLLLGKPEKEYFQELKSLIKYRKVQKNVLWKDFVPNNDLPKYFNAADIGVWPGNPSNVVQEAIACGLPVVLSDHPMNHFLIHRSSFDTKSNVLPRGKTRVFENGYIIQEKHPINSIQEHLETLISSPTIREKMGAWGEKHAKENFSWKSIAQVFLKDL